MADVFQAGDAAAGQGVAVHDAGIELHGADRVGQTAVADRVDLGIVLDGLRPGDGGVQGRLALAQQFGRGFDGGHVRTARWR